MGTGAELWIAAAAAAASAYNTQQTAKRQDREAARGIMNQSRLQREADARLQSEIGDMRGSDPADERSKAMQQFMSQLQRTRSASEGSTPRLAGASDEYQADVESGAAETADYGTRIASLLSRIDAPAMQRRGEAERFARLGTDIGGFGRRSAGEDFLTRLRVGAVRRNPWIDALSSFGGAYAGGSAGGGTSWDGTPAYAPNVRGSNVRRVPLNG